MNGKLPRLDGNPEVVRLAFWGRTSSAEVQDPTLSIPRQLTEVEEKLPPGCVIVAHYWDVESGAKKVEERGRGRDHERFDVEVPRDGGLQELLQAAASAGRPFAGVICSEIARSSRDFVDGLQLEKDLDGYGVPLLAANEPITFDRSNPGNILLRRFNQALAEYQRLDLLQKSRSGMRTSAEQGWNTGMVPYGYLADKVPHPVPSKRQLGLTKTRLVMDPVRGPVVTQVFRWRVEERMGYTAIADRLNADPVAYPPPVGGNVVNAGFWRDVSVRNILLNPKYTGYMVWNQESKKGAHTDSRRDNDPKDWVWSPKPTHEALTDMETWKRAAEIGRNTARSRQGDGANRHPLTQRTYLLRSLVYCHICGRRMVGKSRKGRGTFYRCPTTHRDPRTAKRFPDHPLSLEVTESEVHGAIERFFAEYVFGPNRAELFLRAFGEATLRARSDYQERVANLEARVAAAEKARRGLTRELENLPDDDEMAALLRADIMGRYREREEERRRLVAELEAATAEAPKVTEDPAVLDELPTVALTLEGVPEELQRALFGAFNLTARYDKAGNAVHVSATVTSRLVAGMSSCGQLPGGGADVVSTLLRWSSPPGRVGGSRWPGRADLGAGCGWPV